MYDVNRFEEFYDKGGDLALAEMSWRKPILANCVRSVWLRHDLGNTKKRLKALEAKVAQGGMLLTEAQVAALEKAKQDKEAHGRRKAAFSGRLQSDFRRGDFDSLLRFEFRHGRRAPLGQVLS